MTKNKQVKKQYIQQGWECPKCGSVYAVWVSECKRCANSKGKEFIGKCYWVNNGVELL